jgi:Uncharacterized conserved protein
MKKIDIKKKMPVIFAGHGSPMNAVGDNRARRGWHEIGEALGKPQVIIAVSSHWATQGLFVRKSALNPQINDMYGFPPELYDVHYEPPGSVAYADRTLDLLSGKAEVSNDWGIDHGIWSVLSNIYPDADVPVVMVSTNTAAGAQEQYEIGKLLAPLRNEGALIFASGNVVHNLGLVDWSMNDGYEWADTFDKTISDAISGGDFFIPVEYDKIHGAARAVTTAEHYFPLLTALGAASENDSVTVWNEYRELGSMSMTSYLFE